MNAQTRVAVAMSGGVDSSVSAALLLERGCSILGITMRLWTEPTAAPKAEQAVADAQAVCQVLGIPHHIVDLRRAFSDQVIENFVHEYARGRTPNPCVQCNRILKFGLLLAHVRTLGCDLLATGHYARIERVTEGYRLLCGLDAAKDQAYFLYTLQQDQLATLLFPVGALTKARVRALAESWGLPVSDRRDSQDVCFLSDGDYRRFLAERLPQAVRPGPIYSVSGEHLGEHKGLPFYTVGQREGLGISARYPLYVVHLDTARNALIVGHAQDLGHRALVAEEMSYVSGQEPSPGCAVEAKIRYRARRGAARVWALPQTRAQVVFDERLRDITPGQAVVLYRGDQVLGGGIISHALPEEA